MTRRVTINISIDVPADDCEDLFSQVLALAARSFTTEQVTPEPQPKKKLATGDPEELKRAAREHHQQSFRAFMAKAPLAYRLYRQLRPTQANAAATYKAVAERLSISAPIAAETLVRKHKKKLAAYIKKRRQKTALLMAWHGKTNAEIAAHFGVTRQTVYRMLKAARANPSPPVPPSVGGTE